MDFTPSDRVSELRERIRGFTEEHVLPVEAQAVAALDEQVGPGVAYPELLIQLRERARGEGLWNLFLPDEEHGAGLTNWEYGMLCEDMGRSPVAPMVFNCSAPDTGNMEILAEYGTDEQKERWLGPLLNEHVRSCFSMTEPDTSGSDPTGLAARAELDGDTQSGTSEWVINGHKWFTSGYNGASMAIAMVVTDPDAWSRSTPPGLRACGRCRSWATPAAPATGRSPTRTCGCPRTACSAREGRASRSPRRAWDPGGSTIACARSARPSAPSS
jgi:acyl-CoA dehydrogenase